MVCALWKLKRKKLHLKKITLKYCKSYRNSGLSNSQQRNRKFYYSLLTPLDFWALSFISLTVFAYIVTTMTTTNIQHVRGTLFYSSLHWTDSPGTEDDFCQAHQGLIHILPSVNFTCMGLTKQQPQTNKEQFYVGREWQSGQKCMVIPYSGQIQNP